MNYRDIIVFDFETGSKFPHTTVPLSLAAQAYNPRNLQPIPGAFFNSFMRPRADEWDKIEQGALDVNKIQRADLEGAPDRAVVWKQFVSFVNKFNKKPGDTFNAPIAAGYNILNFDLVIVERLCQEFGPVNKEGLGALFNGQCKFDLMQILLTWYENQPKPTRFSFDAVRKHFGLSSEGAHSARVDVIQTGELLMRFLRLHRNLFPRVPGLRGVEQAEEVAA